MRHYHDTNAHTHVPTKTMSGRREVARDLADASLAAGSVPQPEAKETDVSSAATRTEPPNRLAARVLARVPNDPTITTISTSSLERR